MTAPLAHAGDLVSSVVFLAPMLSVLVWVLVMRWRERRQKANGSTQSSDAEGAERQDGPQGWF
jgi:hypothetical protein